ncbi:MAG: hypothetical protein Q4A82_03700 [Corynebacterium sp.]|nr:hypothetical protein [Corynebacterium sp.]
MTPVSPKTLTNKIAISLALLVGIAIILFPFTTHVQFSAYTPFCFFSGSLIALGGMALQSKSVIGLGFGIVLWTIIVPFFFLMASPASF